MRFSWRDCKNLYQSFNKNWQKCVFLYGILILSWYISNYVSHIVCLHSLNFRWISNQIVSLCVSGGYQVCCAAALLHCCLLREIKKKRSLLSQNEMHILTLIWARAKRQSRSQYPRPLRFSPESRCGISRTLKEGKLCSWFTACNAHRNFNTLSRSRQPSCKRWGKRGDFWWGEGQATGS